LYFCTAFNLEENSRHNDLIFTFASEVMLSPVYIRLAVRGIVREVCK